MVAIRLRSAASTTSGISDHSGVSASTRMLPEGSRTCRERAPGSPWSDSTMSACRPLSRSASESMSSLYNTSDGKGDWWVASTGKSQTPASRVAAGPMWTERNPGKISLSKSTVKSSVSWYQRIAVSRSRVGSTARPIRVMVADLPVIEGFSYAPRYTTSQILRKYGVLGMVGVWMLHQITPPRLDSTS